MLYIKNALHKESTFQVRQRNAGGLFILLMSAELRKRKTSSPDHSPTREEIPEDAPKVKPVALDNNASFFARFLHWLWLPEDASYLGLFRIGWGVIMAYEIWAHVRRNFRMTLIHFYSNKFGFHSKYYLFDWVKVMPFAYMQIFMLVAFLSAVGITIGYKYRLSCVIFFFSISYIFLLDTAHYLNHIYLVIIISFVMIFTPCNRIYAVDSRKQKGPATVPKFVIT